MNDRDRVAGERHGRLADAIREVKLAAVERDDVVVDMREAARMRLELLAQELEPIFDQVPAEEILFDFAISSGTQPRLWIDAVSHVAMGRDRRTYRFVRDTRLGRVVVAESSEIRPVADQVTRYIAERMVERQRWLDGTTVTVRPPVDREEAVIARKPERQRERPDSIAPAATNSNGENRNGKSLLAYAAAPVQAGAETEPVSKAEPRVNKVRSFVSAAGIVLFGAAAGLAILAAVYWDEVAAYVAAY
ncbi:hypothetical protein ABGN05_03160 [Aquibium sp. LZ166]|uniref:Uncharacterized protein n=1 Tax=Aquibium pacificus TaxID=3153579 RepID=A0ABV3SD32_9HYPH